MGCPRNTHEKYGVKFKHYVSTFCDIFEFLSRILPYPCSRQCLLSFGTLRVFTPDVVEGNRVYVLKILLIFWLFLNVGPIYPKLCQMISQIYVIWYAGGSRTINGKNIYTISPNIVIGPDCEFSRHLISLLHMWFSAPQVPVGDVPAIHENPLLLLGELLLLRVMVMMEAELVPVRHVAAVVEARVGGEAATLLLHHLKERAVLKYLWKTGSKN